MEEKGGLLVLPNTRKFRKSSVRFCVCGGFPSYTWVHAVSPATQATEADFRINEVIVVVVVVVVVVAVVVVVVVVVMMLTLRGRGGKKCTKQQEEKRNNI